MRRFLSLGFGAFFLLSSCESHPSSSILLPSDEEKTPQEESDSQIPGQEDPFQSGAGISADNPHFFFLSPLVEGASYSGVAEGGLDVEVAVCPRGSWDDDGEACIPGAEVAVFDTQGGNPGDRVLETLDSEYRVVWDTQSHPAQAGHIYRIVVSVMGQAMGWVDVLAFEDAKSCENGGRGERGCEALPYDPLRGYAAFPYLGTLKIAFRVEEGGVESEFCDPDGVEDCDVEIFTYDQGGCLRVYENPGESGEMLGSQACLPAGAAELDGEPVQGTYAVILTLEKDEAHQGAGDGFGQVPFFPDLRTDPPGISFNPESEGITVVICQATEGDGAVPEDLHPFLRPFLIFSDGSVSLPDEFTRGAPECEGVGSHLHADGGADTGAGWLGRLTRGLSRISKAFLPSPLHAFRLHGGLNTTVYETKTARRGGGDASSPHGPLGGLPTPGEEETFFVELGAFLDVDPLSSGAAVPTSVVLGEEVSIVIDVLDMAGAPLPFEVPVTVEVSGANPGTPTAELVALGQYVAAYTPEALGTDQISILAEGRSLPGPYSVVVQPVPASPSNSSFQVGPSQMGSPTVVTVSVMDEAGQPYVHSRDFPVDVTVRLLDPVSGKLLETVSAEDQDGDDEFDGQFQGHITPPSYGQFQVSVLIGDEGPPDSPQALVAEALAADPLGSGFEATDGLVGLPTEVSVFVRNTAGDPYSYADFRPVQVLATVTGANPASFSASDPDLDGTFTGSYTPTASGTDEIYVSIDGVRVPGTLMSQVLPQTGDLTVVLDLQGPAPADRLPVELYRQDGGLVLASAETGEDGAAVFPDLPFGEYLVHLPRRDLDVTYANPTSPVSHEPGGSNVMLPGFSEELPEGVGVWRIRDGGNGNAYQYRHDLRDWHTANDLSLQATLLGVAGHLATLTSEAENDALETLFQASPHLCDPPTNRADCSDRGWIGLSDATSEGRFRWVTGEPMDFTRWLGRSTPPDPAGDLDFVTFDGGGWWVSASAHSPHRGYFVEWDVTWPDPPGS